MFPTLQEDVIKRELDLLKSLSHGNIVSFLGLQDVPNPGGEQSKVEVVMEVCQGDLKKLLHARKKFSSSETAYIMNEILQGLEYLHGKKVIHR